MARDRYDELDILRRVKPPAPAEAARTRALAGAMAAYEKAQKEPAATQGLVSSLRLTDRTMRFWREMMEKKFIAAPVLAGLIVLPAAGYVGWQMIDRPPFSGLSGNAVPAGEAARTIPHSADGVEAAPPAPPMQEDQVGMLLSGAPQPVARDMPAGGAMPKRVAVPIAPGGEVFSGREGGERFAAFDPNSVRSAAENPVSTFSVDVDTSSYAFVRQSLKEGALPPRESVRVEEFVNYFPYDWAGPKSADVPFNTTVTITPTPWNEGTKLMHVAIRGYDLQPTEKPRSNLVFLIDTSGSMQPADRLPLLKSSLRLLVGKLEPEDTIAIVTYGGAAGTALEPTKVADKDRILAALDRLEAGGSTAGEAGISQAYRLAEEAFVAGGVNRILLATDGDFNVGQTSDEALKRLVEDKRRGGVQLSVLGFGRGNLNDSMMQAIAQNGNGVAAYIDTLAEAQKVLVQEASSSLFTIASDVKVQVEFNPARIAEYRLIGYENRALAREDFNNDRVDAGDIGSGHAVTAIYEVTPAGSAQRMIDDLRYGKPDGDGEAANEDEYAFVRIRYKTPGTQTSKLIGTAVTDADVVPAFAGASGDLRFSVAVAAFGQKLRGTDALAGYGYDDIMEIAAAARGADPFGYRAEFLSLVRLAAALEESR